MYRIIVLVLCNYVLAQPVADDLSAREARQVECCPCPGQDGGPDMVGSSSSDRAVVDDCPCRPRGADSDGASSIFFPSAVRPDGPHMSTIDPKESKNLLEPEVALATSMLDTLREATEEEYRDAVAREAARSAAEPDAVPEESANNVVIVVNPRDTDDDDEFISQASHFQESRCIHPLGSTSLAKQRSSSKPVNVLPETFRFPKLKRPSLIHRNPIIEDSNLGASTVEESIVDMNGDSGKFDLNNPMFKLTTPLKTLLENHNKALNFEKPKLNFGKSDENESSFIDNMKSSFVSKPKSHTTLPQNGFGSTPICEQESGQVGDKTDNLFRHSKLPLNLRNLLKLRDVELIPKTIRNKSINKPKLDVSKFKIPTLLKNNPKEIHFNDNSSEEMRSTSNVQNTNSAKKPDTSYSKISDSTVSKLNTNIFDDCENKIVVDKQENLDALTSPSEFQMTKIRADEETEFAKPNNPNENIPNFNSLESEELLNPMSTELEITEDNTKEIVSEASEPELIIVIAEKDISEKEIQKIDEEVAQDQVLDGNQDSDTESSNIISTLVTLENQERAADIIPQFQENITSACNQEIDISREEEDEILPGNLETNPTINKKSQYKEIPSLGKTMSIMRENVTRPIENLKKPSITSKLPKIFGDKEISVTKEEESHIDNNNFNQKKNDILFTKAINPFDIESLDAKTKQTKQNSDISIHDLQDMSNKLLDPDSNNQNHERNTNNNSVIFQPKQSNSDIDMKSFETKLDPIVIENHGDIRTNHESVEENACLTSLDSKNIQESVKTSELKDQGTEVKEMETGASDNVINTLPGIFDSLNSNLKLRTPLLDDIILQPQTDPLNILGKPLGDVLHLNTNFPTLDDLRERLANIFNTNDRSVENDSCSLESDGTIDTPFETMAPEASTINTQKELSSLNPFESFNVDIFRKNPITNPSKSILSTPKFNLNSYRSKVPVPSSLDLKPANIKSTLVNKVGTDRSLLNLGSGRTSARYAKPRNLLADPLDNIPTLENLRYNLQSNSRNLLNRPIDPNLNLFNENLRSNNVEDLAENFRLNTQKTMKGIQQKMKSTLKKTKVQSPLGDPFAKPQELLDDMNDKLKAIHYDLNDRLSSLHENIMDSSRIKSIVDQPRKASNRNVMTKLQRNKAGQSSSRLQPAASTMTTQEIDPNGHNAKQRDFTFDKDARNFIHKEWNKSHKIQHAAESAPSPVRIGTPKSANPPLSYKQRTPIRQTPTINKFLNERKPVYSRYENARKPTDFVKVENPIFRTAENPFNYSRQPNRVTISFGTTTAKPILTPRPVIRIPNVSPTRSEEHDPNISSSLNGKPQERVPKIHKLQSAKVTPVKFNPLRTSSAVPSAYDEEFEENFDDFSDDRSVLKNYNSKPSVHRESSNLDPLRVGNKNENGFKSANIFDNTKQTEVSANKPPFNWPKINENSFFSKVKNAIQTRNSDNHHKNIDIVETEQVEMLRAPSENTDIVLQEPLKENVSYRCRMVCTKEIR